MYTWGELEAAARRPTTVLPWGDPAFADAVIEHLIATGRIFPSCGELPPLGGEVWAAMRQVGLGKDEEPYGAPSCLLRETHTRVHAALLHEVDEGRNIWMQWSGEMWSVFVADDCPVLNTAGEGCTLWLKHPGPHAHP